MPRIEVDPSAPLALAMDTSGPVETVTIVQGALVLTQAQARRSRSGNRVLSSTLVELLASVARTPRDLAVVAVVLGPGALTGVRVGIATAQGLADGLGIPALGYRSTDGWALAAGRSSRPVGVALDARRGEVYSALYEIPDAGPPQLVRDICLESPDSWFDALAERCPDGVVLVGDGSRLYADQGLARLGEGAWIGHQSPAGPDLSGIAMDALAQLDGPGKLEEGPLHPIYLRNHDGTRVIPS